ncbi:MAG TPA: glycogen/starch/alpha-glucan phosphorylase [Blastocatellia bacterium]|nr:glycogen/starch/alpha-glucan phosphorylase [Blastocatellia bacterium]
MTTSEERRSDLSGVQTIQEAIRLHAKYTLAKRWNDLTRRDVFLATAMAVRDCLIDGILETEERYQQADAKCLYYLSMEFLVGRSLGNNLLNLGLLDVCRRALLDLGVDLEEVRETEPDAALGNGGLGRLAACFMDSLATLGMPGFGYGINYEYGLFKQGIENGYQKEQPDHWRAHGSPWLVERPDEACIIPVYGRIEHVPNGVDNKYHPAWKDWKVMIGVPADMPIVGYGGRTINYLRLYSAVSEEEFDMQIFNQGDYIKAVEANIAAERVSKVLYPSDSIEAGRELRLLQEYFLVACAVRDILRRYQRNHTTFDEFAEKVAIQMNDTHPALTVAELMRVLIDENSLEWDDAWEITTATLGFTNHTLMPEALERWSSALLERVLPRHLQIIYEINQRFSALVLEKYPGDWERLRRMSIIEEGERKQVRMGHLAIIGSHSVNGVAQLHSELVKTRLVPDFYQLWPDKFNNKTNGVTQRRWLLKANPKLARLINNTIGDAWITDLDTLRALEPWADDAGFQEEFRRIKRANKERLARVIRDANEIDVDPATLFDVQVKRIHEYKRQLLNVLHIIHDYVQATEEGKLPAVARTYVFAGKAAPGYWAAKQIIKLINSVGQVINADRRVNELMKVVFIPDYKVSLAERIIPAADLSEQISTAGKEASGTGNMKFAMNGALTIGTFDGANIEICEEVGEENIYIFGLRAEALEQMRETRSYNPREYYETNPAIRRVLDALQSDLFCKDEPGLFTWIFDSLVGQDEYFHLADLPSYIETQELVSREFLQPDAWARKAITNVARIGKFSSDRTVMEYARDIWNIESV